ncbi:hypothetical protein H6771_01990 [Candidatus Peribacteria bacterium]|nr:hypothetical protein [Candidatus Peribacteria bacterium]
MKKLLLASTSFLLLFVPFLIVVYMFKVLLGEQPDDFCGAAAGTVVLIGVVILVVMILVVVSIMTNDGERIPQLKRKRNILTLWVLIFG